MLLVQMWVLNVTHSLLEFDHDLAESESGFTRAENFFSSEYKIVLITSIIFRGDYPR